MHPDGQMFTPYGATEALPIASIESREVLGETRNKTQTGAGTCVGKRFQGIEWKVIAITDSPLARFSDVREVPPGEIGELIVTGPVVTTSYATRIEQNAFHKVEQFDESTQTVRVWHRMGDVGYLDDQDRFWYCGRKGHRVITPRGPLFTEPIEAVVNAHPQVFRSALVPLGQSPSQRPCVIVEPWPNQRATVEAKPSRAASEWQALIQAAFPGLEIDCFLVYPKKLPTDIRHNSKIFREQLKPWAEKVIAQRGKS
jgi:acyl-CoA synthetase (AMP-forming)/AMP-acid ligase II